MNVTPIVSHTSELSLLNIISPPSILNNLIPHRGKYHKCQDRKLVFIVLGKLFLSWSGAFFMTMNCINSNAFVTAFPTLKVILLVLATIPSYWSFSLGFSGQVAKLAILWQCSVSIHHQLTLWLTSHPPIATNLWEGNWHFILRFSPLDWRQWCDIFSVSPGCGLKQSQDML